MNEIMRHAQEVIGIGFESLEQGSPEWMMARLGVLTASEADKILAANTTQKKKTYISTKIGEIITGIPKDEVSAASLAWGKENEPAARSGYEFLKNEKIIETGFLFKDKSLRTGCSLDGELSSSGKPVEIKCPKDTRYFVDIMIFNQFKPEWLKQFQYIMWVKGSEALDSITYDPRAIKKKMIIKEFEKDEKMHSLFKEATQEVIELIDKNLELSGYSYGDQWRDRIDVSREIA